MEVTILVLLLELRYGGGDFVEKGESLSCWVGFIVEQVDWLEEEREIPVQVFSFFFFLFLLWRTQRTLVLQD